MTDANDEALVAEIRSLRSELKAAKLENAALVERVESLVRVVAGLEKRLGVNSSNSSLPPSSDRFTTPAKQESR